MRGDPSWLKGRYLTQRRPLLHQLNQYTQRTAKKAGIPQVFFRVSRFHSHDDRARLMKFEPDANGRRKKMPTEYEVVVDRRLLQEHEKNPQVIKRVISHELAHFKHPNTHGQAFKRECRRLGGGNRCVARGIEGSAEGQRGSARPQARRREDPMARVMEAQVRRLAPQVTRYPVHLRVAGLGRGEGKTAAALDEYDRPKEYVLTVTPDLVRGCRRVYGPRQCPREIKKFIAHEMAHIGTPGPEHGPAFQRKCTRLGGGDRCRARGTKTDPLHRWRKQETRKR
jgi:hypothetical protein